MSAQTAPAREPRRSALVRLRRQWAAMVVRGIATARAEREMADRFEEERRR